MPCTPKRARLLLDSRRARVHRLFPFAIRLTDRLAADSVFQSLDLKLDPGSVTTGIAVVRCAVQCTESLMQIQFLMELVHRGRAIQASLHSRSCLRRGRRSRNLRYRVPRFNNRTKPRGWLAPSLMHRVETTMAWVARLRKLAPITQIAQELVRFDMQKMDNAEISGVEYQQGTLIGYEVREYLLEKFNRQCAYCDISSVPLQIEHINPKARGGTNRISNLTLGCQTCNSKKAARAIQDFLKKDPARLAKILAQSKAPLRDASAVNSTRWELYESLKATGLPVVTGTGGQTKWNRSQFGLSKTHALDAVCVGNIGQAQSISGVDTPTLRIKCTGRGSRCRTRVTAQGFPRAYLARSKTAFGFRTGDMVIANVTKGKKVGQYAGRVAIRQTGNFNIQSGNEGASVIQGISYRYCRITQRGDGYGYLQTKTNSHSKNNMVSRSTALLSAPYLPALKDGVSRSN